MGHTVTGKLNKPASQFAAGESTGFGIRIGVKAYNRETKQDEWVNYEAAIFAKQPNQVQFYQNALVEGSIVSISCENLSIRQFQGNNGLQLSLAMNNASLEYVHNPSQQQAQQQPMQGMQQPQQYQQPQQMAPQQGATPPPGYVQPMQQPNQIPAYGNPPF
jgi:single-strand DNA-binding protein